MAKQVPPPSSSRSRQRGKPVQVQAKKPVGFIVGAVVLALALVGIVAYAALNQGAGFQDPLEKADSSFDGSLTLSDAKTLTRNHVTTPVKYPTTPPDGGDHSAVWEDCGVYTAQVPNENAVHSLEHGAVWVTYQPDLPAAQVATLTKAVQDQSYALLSPYPGQKDKIMLTAWGRQLSVTSADDKKVEKFVDTYASGPQTPEQGASCSGGVKATGTTPAEPSGTTASTAPTPVG